MGMKDEEEEENERYVGRVVKKFFEGFGFFNGKVIAFDRACSYFKVAYDDGDMEELELKELREILVGKGELQFAEKPRGRRGRKRGRDSPGQIGIREAGRTEGAKISSGAKPKGAAKKLGCISDPEKKSGQHGPSNSDEANVLREDVQEVVNEAAEEGAEQEDKLLLDPLLAISSVKVFEKNSSQLERTAEHAGEAKGKKRTREPAAYPPDTSPPCRLKRSRVSPSSDSWLPQITDVDLQTPRVENAHLERKEEAEAVEKMEDAFLETLDLPLASDENGVHSSHGGFQSFSHDEKVGNPFSEGEGRALTGSLVLSLPPSSKSLGALDHSVAELFQVYSLLRSFSNVIFLSPFSLEEFVYALNLTDVSSMIDCVHLSLLQTLRRQLERLSRNGSKSATFTLRLADWSLLDNVTWPSFLTAYLLTQGFTFEYGHNFAKAGFSALEYYKLSVGTKLIVLSFLCDKILDTEEARAELARRAILENDIEVIEPKGCLAKSQERNLKDSTILEGDFEDDSVGPSCTQQGEDAASMKPELLERSTSSAANSIRIGRHLDEDGNLDECVLCAMDGILICCDGCPAAYHSRCVGVTKQGLPPGDWFCPECRADKQDQRGANISKGVRGGELLIDDGPGGYLFFATCGYLLISEPGRQGSHRYYSARDLPKVMKFLGEAGPSYTHLQSAVQQLCQSDANNANITLTPTYSAQRVSSAGSPSLALPSQLGENPAAHEGSSAGFPPSVVMLSENEDDRRVTHGNSSQSGGEFLTKDQRLLATSHSLAEQTQNLEPRISYISSELWKIGNPCGFASSPPREEYEQSLELFARNSVEQMKGLISDPNIMNHEEGDEKKPFLNDDSPAQLVNGDEFGNASVDSISRELDEIWKLHAGHDFTFVSSETTVMTGLSTEAQANDQMSVTELNSDHTGQLPDAANPQSFPAVPLTDPNPTTISADVDTRKVFRTGTFLPLVSCEGNVRRTCDLAKEATEPQRTEQKDMHACSGKSIDTSKHITGRNEREEDYLSTLTQINACTYTNKYANCDFVATAAFNLAVMAGIFDDGVDDKGGSQKKAKPTSVADQIKAFTQASAHFFWPSFKKRNMDVPKEKCGWCINCRLTGRRGCLLTQVAGPMAGGAAIVVGGIRPVKCGYGHYPAVAAYLLYMEETLHGLLMGPWESPGYRKIWRKQVEQAKSLQDATLSLLEMEACLRDVALSQDWDKVEEDAPESIANSVFIVNGAGFLVTKKTPKKRGRPPVLPKTPVVGSYDGSCFGMYWWRGGSLSRQVYNWESLPRAVIKRAGRRGGFKEISDLLYSRTSDLPRRTRRFAWRTRLEKISSIAQLAVEVRYLDEFIKWNDIISPQEASTTHNLKGPVESDPAYRNAKIRAKSNGSGTVMYLLGFPDDPDDSAHTFNNQQLEAPLKSSALTEKSSNKKQQGVSKGAVWVAEDDVPLFLIKDFEEGARNVNHSKLLKSLKKGKVSTITPQKKSSFWKMLSSPRLAGVLQSKKLSNWICGECKLSGLESQSVQCQRCSGKFHRNCTQVEDSVIGGAKVLVCKKCTRLRLGQRIRKPSYKMLDTQSQLADSMGGYGKRAFISDSVEEASKCGAYPRQRNDRESPFATQPQLELSAKKKNRLLSVAIPSHFENEAASLLKNTFAKKTLTKSLILEVGPSHDPVQSGKKQYGKMHSISLADVDSLSHEHDLNQPKKRGRKKKLDSLGASQSQIEQDTSPQERRASGRTRNMGSAVSPPVEPDLPLVLRGKRKADCKLQMHFTSESASQCQDEASLNRSPCKQKKLKIIFAGLEATAPVVNNGDVCAETQKRKSGNGLDYGSRSVKSDADIQRFRQERLLLTGQVCGDPANAPVCGLCCEGYVPGMLFVSCEYCKVWFHGDAVGLKPGDAAFLMGFKCHKCRKCRAPSCPMRRNAGVKTRRKGAIDHGEVIDAENVNRTAHLEGTGYFQSSWLNSPGKEHSAFIDAKAFPDFDDTTEQARAPAVHDSSSGHDVLDRDFDARNLALSADPQHHLAPISLGDQQVDVWASNNSTQLGFGLSRAQPSLSFTELLASEDEFEGLAGTGVELSAKWTTGMWGSVIMAGPLKPSTLVEKGFTGPGTNSIPVTTEVTPPACILDKIEGNDSHMPKAAAVNVSSYNGDEEMVMEGNECPTAGRCTAQ